MQAFSSQKWWTLWVQPCPADPLPELRSHLVAGHPVNEICRGRSRQTHDLLKLVNILSASSRALLKSVQKTISNRKQSHTKASLLQTTRQKPYRQGSLIFLNYLWNVQQLHQWTLKAMQSHCSVGNCQYRKYFCPMEVALHSNKVVFTFPSSLSH